MPHPHHQKLSEDTVPDHWHVVLKGTAELGMPRQTPIPVSPPGVLGFHSETLDRRRVDLGENGTNYIGYIETPGQRQWLHLVAAASC